MTSWQIFYEEGLGYRETLNKAVSRPEIFTPVIMYNLASMAIEKLFMALLLFDKRMPDNHTLIDIIHAVEKKHTVSRELIDSLEYMDSLQQICTVEKMEQKMIGQNNIPSFISTCENVYTMVYDVLRDALKEL